MRDPKQLACALEALLYAEKEAGHLRTEYVRCIIKMVTPEDWVEDPTHEEGGYYEPTGEPDFPVVLAQAYSYVGLRPNGELTTAAATVAGQVEMAPRLLEMSPMDTFLPPLVSELQHHHDAEYAKHGFSA